MSERMPVEEWRKLIEKLAQPFETMDFLPRAARDGKAIALAYIDSRDVQTRLDNVCGPNWSFDFVPLSDNGKMVKGMLTIYGVTRCDAGESGPEDEPLKSAVSDALKRCAVQFGVGRYLYHLPTIRAPYDQQYKKWTEKPTIEARVIARAVALAIGNTLGEPSPYKPAPLASREEAAANRQEPPVDSAGDRAATQRPPAAQQPRQQAPAPTQAAPEARAPRQPVTESSVGNLKCQGKECGRPLNRAQHDLSIRNFGAAYCPACQKNQTRTAPEGPAAKAETPAANGREKTPLETARAAYMAKLNDVFGPLEDRQRYAIEAVLLGEPEPLKPGAKRDYTVEDWKNFRGCVEQCDVKATLEKAKAMVNVNRVLDAPSSAQPAFSGLQNS